MVTLLFAMKTKCKFLVEEYKGIHTYVYIYRFNHGLLLSLTRPCFIVDNGLTTTHLKFRYILIFTDLLWTGNETKSVETK